MESAAKKPRLVGVLNPIKAQLEFVLSERISDVDSLASLTDPFWLKGACAMLDKAFQVKFDSSRITVTMIVAFLSCLGEIPADTAFDETFLRLDTCLRLMSCLPLLSETEPAKGDSVDYNKLLKESFSIRYKEAHATTLYFLKYADQCLDLYDPTLHYSPYIAVINASMTFACSMTFASINAFFINCPDFLPTCHIRVSLFSTSVSRGSLVFRLEPRLLLIG